MAEPAYTTIMTEVIDALRATAHYRHVAIDDQIEASADQCPAVLVSMPRVRWEVENLSGGVDNTRAPFWITISVLCRLCVFSAQGPVDAVMQRATLLQQLVSDLRNVATLGGLVTLMTPLDADLPEPSQDAQSAALWARALLTLEARVQG